MLPSGWSREVGVLFWGGGEKGVCFCLLRTGLGIGVLSSHTVIHPAVSVASVCWIHAHADTGYRQRGADPACGLSLTEAGWWHRQWGTGHDMVMVGWRDLPSALDPNELSRVHRTLLTQEATPGGGPRGSVGGT